MRLLLIIYLIQSSICIAQPFEGEIVYKVEIKNAFPESVADSTFKMMYQEAQPSNQSHYFKDEYFKTIADGPTGRMISVFDPTTKRVYSYTEGAEVGLYTEANENQQVDSIRELNIYESILGVECVAFATGNEMSQTITFYPKKFRNEILQMRKDVDRQRKFQKLGANPMKMEIRGSGPHFVVMTAVKIHNKKLSQDFFQIPKFKQVLKMKFP